MQRMVKKDESKLYTHSDCTLPMYPCDGHALVFYLRSKLRNNLSTDRGSHLNILVLSTAAELTNEINAAMQCNYHCCRDKSFFVEDRGQHLTDSSGLKPQQLHPCTVHASDGVCWPQVVSPTI